jgi:hypothetical protein
MRQSVDCNSACESSHRARSLQALLSIPQDERSRARRFIHRFVSLQPACVARRADGAALAWKKPHRRDRNARGFIGTHESDMLRTTLRHAATAIACAAALLGASAAEAAVLTFNDRSAWNAAVASPTIVDFDGFTGSDAVRLATSFTEGGVKFELAAGTMFGLGPSSGGFAAGRFYGNGYLEWQNATPNTLNTLTITLPEEVHAIGFDFAEINGGIDTFTVVVDGQAFTVDSSEEGALFFGLTDTDGFTTLAITDLNGITPTALFPTIDNLSFASDLVTEVPEPASLLLLLAAALSLWWHTRRSHH